MNTDLEEGDFVYKNHRKYRNKCCGNTWKLFVFIGGKLLPARWTDIGEEYVIQKWDNAIGDYVDKEIVS
jgi:hypothetical protein